MGMPSCSEARRHSKKKRVTVVNDNRHIYLFFVFSVFFSFNSLAVVKGSESAVSVQPLAVFPAADNDNEMLGFGWFKNGFTLEDSSTTCTFNSVYPVAGTADLQGGSLYLTSDLKFSNTACLQGGGNIYGEDYTLELCSSMATLASTFTLHDTTLLLGGDLTVSDIITFEGTSYINALGYHIDFEVGGALFVPSGATLALDDIELRGISTDNIILEDDTSKLILQNVSWVQNGDFVFDKGSIEFFDSVEFKGSYTFFYESTQTSTIDANTRWIITDDLKLSIGRSDPDDFVEPLYFVDDTSILRMDNCSFEVNSSGIGLTKGALELDRDVWVDVLSSTTTNGLIIGTGQEADDFSMKLDSGASIHLNSGCWVYNNYNSTGKLHALSEVSHCLRYADSKFYVMNDWTIPPMVFKVASGNPESVLCDGVTFRYNNTHLANSMVEFHITGQELTPGFRLSGDDYIYMTRGSLPLPVYVSGSGNKLHGTGDIAGGLILEDETSSVCCHINGAFAQDIALGGGEFILLCDLDLDADTVFTGSGTVILGDYCINLGAKDDTWSSDIEWQGSGGSLEFKGNVDLTSTWTFDGKCVVDGNGNVLRLQEDSKIIVSEGSTLTLRDVTVRCISGGEVRCLDDAGTIKLDNVRWVQDDDFTFDTGRFEFVNSVDFCGSFSFVYDSSQTSTIKAHSVVSLTDDITFVVGRKEAGECVEPLAFEDLSSVISLHDCSFIITASGMNFTKGTLEVSGEVALEALATDSLHGFEVGNSLEADDVNMVFEAGGNLHIKKGWIVYNCFAPDCFTTRSESACITRYAESKLYLKTNWLFPRMVGRVHSGIPLTVFDDKTITWDHTLIAFTSAEFEIWGQQVSPGVFRLMGDNAVFLTKGSLLAYIYVLGTGNLLYGTGDITGPIIFVDSAAELNCSLNGALLFSPIMNGGKIILDSDLYLGPDIVFSGAGQVDLEDNRLVMSPKDCDWESDTAWNGTGGSIALRANVDLSSTWTFEGSCIIDGRGKQLTLADDGQIVIGDGADLTLRNMILHGVSEENVRCLSDDSNIELDNVIWVQDDHFTFTTGSMKFLHDVDLRGSYSFIYDSSQTSTIGENSRLSLQDDITLIMGRKEAGDCVEPLAFGDETSVLDCNKCSFIVTESGMRFTKGRVDVSGEVFLEMLATDSLHGLELGSGEEDDDITLSFGSGGSFHFVKGWMVYNCCSPNSFVTSSESAQIVRYGDSKVLVKKDWVLPRMTVSVDSGAPSTISDGAYITYDNVHVIFPTAELDLSAEHISDAEFRLSGDDAIYLTKGLLLAYIYVLGTDNILYGTGDMAGPIIFLDPTATLNCSLNGALLYNPVMNGGKFVLDGDLYLGPEVVFSGAGQMDLEDSRIVLSSKDCAWESPTAWTGSGGSICFRANIDLSSTWTFGGDCIVDGRGKKLSLEDDGELVVESGANLTLRNVVLAGVSENKVRCLADDGNITFDNVTWVQDGHFTFTSGSMKFLNDVDFRGTYSFIYDSSQTSTIDVTSKWMITDGMTLKTGRKESFTGTEPFYFVDDSSVLNFEDCSFLVTSSGMSLTRGRIAVDGDVTIDGLSTVTDGGFMIGNGQADDDVEVYLYPGASIKFQSGWLVYNNVSPNGFVSASDSARAVRYGDSKAYIMTDWVFPNMILKVASGLPVTLLKDGATLNYNNSRLVFNNAEFDLTGGALGSAALALDGNDSLYMTKGQLLSYLYISGTGNELRGTGDITGLMTLQDSSSDLTYFLNGTILQSPVLNGGKITLSANLKLGPAVSFVGPGEVDLNGFRCHLGLSDYVWEDDLTWIGGEGSIELSSQVSLQGDWTFTETTVLEGNGNLLDLNSAGNIIVDDGATLILRDITLEGISGTQIRCASDTANIIFDNVSWVQDGDFTFDTGSFTCRHDVRFGGKYTFDYQSTETSTIASQATLRLESGLVFRYNPVGSDSRDLLAFADDTATLSLKGATLDVSSVGLYLKKGKFAAKGTSCLSCDVDLLDELLELDDGIVFGDGQAENDIVLEVSPGANLNVIQGSVGYRNSSAASLNFVNYLSTLQLSPDTRFVVIENFNLGVGKLQQSKQAFVHVMDGKKLSGAVFMVD